MAHSSQTRFGAAKSEATGCKARHRTRSDRTSVPAPVEVSQSGFGPRRLVNGPYRRGVIETERLLLRGWQPVRRRAVRGAQRRPGGDALPARADDARARATSCSRASAATGRTTASGSMPSRSRTAARSPASSGLPMPSFLPDVLPAVEVGWRLAREHWGKGYATEGARASLRHGFGELGLRQIISIIDPRQRRVGPRRRAPRDDARPRSHPSA